MSSNVMDTRINGVPLSEFEDARDFIIKSLKIERKQLMEELYDMSQAISIQAEMIKTMTEISRMVLKIEKAKSVFSNIKSFLKISSLKISSFNISSLILLDVNFISVFLFESKSDSVSISDFEYVFVSLSVRLDISSFFLGFLSALFLFIS